MDIDESKKLPALSIFYQLSYIMFYGVHTESPKIDL